MWDEWFSDLLQVQKTLCKGRAATMEVY